MLPKTEVVQHSKISYLKLFPGPARSLGQPYLYLIDNFAREERHIKVDLFAAGEPERAKMAAKPPIFASLNEKKRKPGLYSCLEKEYMMCGAKQTTRIFSCHNGTFLKSLLKNFFIKFVCVY